MTSDENLQVPDSSAVCESIEMQVSKMMSFWKDPFKRASEEWQPAYTSAMILNQSMLEWQVSLAKCLRHWLTSSTDGELILAWANLGALVEGQLKLFLCVYYTDYSADAAAIRKKGKLQNPDGCALEDLRQYCLKSSTWVDGRDWNPWIEHIQKRRNAIHAFQAREIGTFDEWKEDLKTFLDFLDEIDTRLPYP